MFMVVKIGQCYGDWFDTILAAREAAVQMRRAEIWQYFPVGNPVRVW